MFKMFSRIALISTVLAISACAVIQPKTDEERVFALAEQRQEALLKHDFKRAYQFMSPGYRELNSLEQFHSNHAGVYSWVSSSVKNVSCEDEICKVNVEIKYDAQLMMNAVRKQNSERFLIPRVNLETWFKMDGKWWFSKSE